MIDILLQKAGAKIGREMKTRGDCELLSNAIFEILDVDLSYNTIRRLYGLAPAVKPSVNTLNIIAKFCYFKNFTHFTQTHIYEKKSDISQLVYKAVYVSDTAEIIDLVKNIKKSSPDFIGFLINLTRELLYNNQFLILDTVYRLKELNCNNFTYSEILELGNSIGLLLRKVKIKEDLLIINTNFLRCVYLTFVDYSSLNGYYGAWADQVFAKSRTQEINTFTAAILEFKNFLNNREINDQFGNLAFSKNVHPILCSRLMAIKLLVHNKDETTALLDKYYKIHSPNKLIQIDYSFELFLIAILTKNSLLMSYLIRSLNDSILFHYQKHYLNSFNLMCMYYYKWTGNLTRQKEYASLFELSYVRNSYEEFILLLYNVYLYADTKSSSKKASIKRAYDRLSEKMQYPYFSESFLEEYFIR
jgi:hypothetical protein